MTFCAEFRLDGQPPTTALVERMLAASSTPIGGGVRAFVVGPLAVAAAAGPALGPGADVTRTAGGLLAVVDGWSPPVAGLAADPDGAALDPRRASGQLAAAWTRFGAFGLDRLLGDWAALVFEQRTGRLVLARSPRSMRTLVLRPGADRVLVATGLAQLRAAGPAFEVNQTVLAETLLHSPTTEHETLVRGVERVPAGHLVRIEARAGERPSRRAYSSLYALVPPLAAEPVETAAARVRPALWAAVADAARCGSANPGPDLASTQPGPELAASSTGPGRAGAGTGLVAVGLSGGVDSSAVTGIAARLAAAGGLGPDGSARLLPISMVFPGEPHDESRWIDAVEEHTGVPVLRVKPDAYDWDRWRAWTATTGELPPWANLALADAVRAAARREGVTVLLSGEGGDDWFRGGRGHWPDLLRAGRLATLRRQIGPVGGPRGLLAKARTARALAAAAASAHTAGPPSVVPPWIRPQWLRPLYLTDRLAVATAADTAAFASADHRRRWVPAAYRDATPLVDTARTFYASAGIDWRHPLHDRRVIEAALSTPGATMYRRDLTKPVLRAAAGDVLAPVVRDRAGRAHFLHALADAVDGAGGLRALLAGGPLAGAGWVDVDAATSCWDAAVAALRRGQRPPVPEHGLVALWPVVAADTWLAHSGVRL
ncbi:asparagine synthase-related protein [Pseudofrankia inefficax]|uniref:asparagine synthase (glutamine-hydrolyzing) n=1 Tax=Pseudofrankia inefficax (strain DSM 45817 / CECT 9037 / DDB 130130 / EuI1c) TaxID=298654 RepID=E3J328_PSEI1|nr:asparagine synthetase B family protein [Pseudofrankia inefficax]ADP82978.1 asparagine synthase [Pseudofrankia inefficax]